MHNGRSAAEVIKNALQELTQARDEVKVQVHLLSVEAKQRWNELESKMMTLESKLSVDGDKVADAAISGARELKNAVQQFLSQHGVARSILDNTALSIMSRDVWTCSPWESLNRAAQIMWDANVGSVPVVDNDRRVVGIITDRDVCMAAYTRGQLLHDCTVASAMSTVVYACSPDDTVSRVVDIMVDRQVRRVPVIEADQRLVGIVSLADLARLVRSPGAQRDEASAVFATALAAISEHPAPPVPDSAAIAAE